MKKRIFGCLAVLAIAAIAAVNVNLNLQKNDLTSVSLNNVEALSDVECKTTDVGGTLVTHCTGRMSLPEEKIKKKYCTAVGGSCSYNANGEGS